ncbi:MAG: FAD:protein FMN transferase [Acidobacteria bacterium]|nr:FAD:protein FMN transferase [Acidobacteriota bacterium]
MGTAVEIAVAQASPDRAGEAIAAGMGEVERLDRLLSHFRADSEIGRINRRAGKEETLVSSETLEVIEKALHVSRLSGGAFDPTIGPVFRLWNFREGKIPPPAALRERLSLVDYRKVRLDRIRSTVFLARSGMELDLGAVAKGYAVDRASAVLRGRGIENFLINAGGDLRVGGGKGKGVPWEIGIRHPRLSSGLIARLRLTQAAVATSGDYEKFFLRGGERYHHILDPATGLPARKCQSVTVLAPEALPADALATAVFVLGPERGLDLVFRLEGVHVLLVNRRGNVLLSPAWPEGVLLPP